MAGNGNKVMKLELRLVDGLSGPAKAAMRSINKLNKTLGSVSGAAGAGAAMGGGRSSLGSMAGTARGARAALGAAGGYIDHTRRRAGEVAALAAAGGAGLTVAARSAYEAEKELNAAQAAGNLTIEQRTAIEKNAVAMNRKYTAGVSDIIRAHTELLRSGLSFEDSFTSLPNVLNLSQATGEGTIDTARAITTNLVALRQEMKESARSADLFVQALDRTAGVSLGDIETSGKYYNPVASATGVSPEEAMAAQIEMARRGIFGSSAGTGLRAGPAALLAPTKKARTAFARLGIDPNRYRGQRSGDATAEQILGALDAQGMPTDGLEDTVAAIVASRKTDGEKVRAIVRSLGDELGAVTAEDRAELAQTLADAFSAGRSRADVPAFLADLKKKGAGFADFEGIFGRNHASKFLGFDPAAYAEELRLIRENATGMADKKSTIMVGGIVQNVNDLDSSLQSLISTLKHSGAMSDAARAMTALAAGVDRVGEANPQLLRFGVAATAAAIAAVPLGFAISGASAAMALAVNPLALATAGFAAFAAVNFDKITDALDVFRKSTLATLDPAIIRRMAGLGTSARRMFANFKIGDDQADAIGQLARNLGRGLAAGANAIGAALPNIEAAGRGLSSMAAAKWDAAAPKLRAYGEAMRQLAADSAAANLPTIRAGMDSIRQAVAGFASTKIDAIVGLGSSLAAFGERVLPMFGPAASNAVKIAAESFRTMAAGVNALGSISNAALDGVVSFVTGFINNLDPAAMQAAANGVKAALDVMAGPARAASDAFGWITTAVGGANDAIEAFAGGAGAALAQGMSAIVNALAAPAEAVIALFNRIKAAIEAAKAAIASMGNLGGAFAGLPSGGAIGTPAGRAGAAIGAMAPPLPRRAAGGLVRGGRDYLVGERGPEVLRMGSQGGGIIPNHRMGGNVTNNTFHIRSSDPQGVVNEVMRKMGRQVSRSTGTAMDGRWDY